MKMNCKRCGGDVTVTLVKDKRGLPEAHCSVCGANLKKMSTSEAIAYYEEMLAVKQVVVETPSEEKPLCKYCREDLFMRRGRLGTVYTPLPDAKYCPMCGRKKKPEDRNY